MKLLRLRSALRCRAGGLVVAEVMGLPRITQISAGHHQAVLSDGERVWTMGTWMDKSGRRVGARPRRTVSHCTTIGRCPLRCTSTLLVSSAAAHLSDYTRRSSLVGV